MGQEFQKKGGDHQTVVAFGKDSQCLDQHDMKRTVRFAILRNTLNCFQQRFATRQTLRVVSQRHKPGNRLHLGNGVEVTTSSVQLDRYMAQRFKPRPELGFCSTDPFGNTADLAVVVSVETDNPVSFAELPGPQHHSLIPVKTHLSGRHQPRRNGGPGPGTL